MITREKAVLTFAAPVLTMLAAMPAQALTMQECSAKYKAAQTANTLNGQKWNDFRKEQCGGDAAAGPAAAGSDASKTAQAKPATAPKSTAPSAPASAAIYPSAVDAKYAK